jgi:hypothetical protein
MVSYTQYSTAGYRAAELCTVWQPEYRVSDIPVILCHGGGDDYNQWLGFEAGGYGPILTAMMIAEAGLVALAADLGGLAPWGNDAMCHSSTGAIADLMAWSATNFDTEANLAAFVGLSHGYSAINWCRANPTKFVAMAGMIPGMDLEQLYNRNPLGLVQSQVNAAYGVNAGTVGTIYPTRDWNHPNAWAGQQAVADKLAIWYGLDDTVAIPAEAVDYCNNTGAEAHPMEGVGHDFDFDQEPMISWVVKKVRAAT